MIQSSIDDWRRFISENFYECTIEIFRGLGELYVTDKRFTKNIDNIKQGLSNYLQLAINYYCDNQ
ncbi:TipAS antibiotic-recognition domain-containing protein [Mycoplasmatota bacterium zrk1]